MNGDDDSSSPLDGRTTEELIDIALGDIEALETWTALLELHRRGSRVELDAARALAAHPCARHRQLAADILAQLGFPQHPFREQSISVLLPILSDPCSEVVAAAAHAFSHLKHPASVARLAELVAYDDREVRFAVDCALGGNVDDVSLQALLHLMNDHDDQVRNWATFGLGVLGDADSEPIRKALLERTKDAYLDARGEALEALAARGDRRVLGPLRHEIEAWSEGEWVFNAALLLPGRSLLPALLDLRARLTGDEPDYEGELLRAALAACAAAP